MKITIYLSVALAFSLAIFGAACKDQASSNSISNANTPSGQTNMDHSGHDMSNMPRRNMSNMPGHDMSNMNSDPNAASQPYDLQFLDSMIHHHAGAVSMSKMVLTKTERPELKAFADKIIADQSKEIDHMKQLREQWYSGKPPAVNMELAGMIGGMKLMNSEHMKEMSEMEPKHFDGHFLKMMIAHHEGALDMSNEALKKAEHPEIKTLAELIIKAQQPEIKQMKEWLAAWDK